MVKLTGDIENYDYNSSLWHTIEEGQMLIANSNGDITYLLCIEEGFVDLKAGLLYPKNDLDSDLNCFDIVKIATEYTINIIMD